MESAGRGVSQRADRQLPPDARPSPFEAEDAVQDTMLRAFGAGLRPLRGTGSAALVALPHRDERLPRLSEGEGAARASDDLGLAQEPVAANLERPAGSHVDRAGTGTALSSRTGILPKSRSPGRRSGSPWLRSSTFRPGSAAVLILCEALRWKATEVAELLETSVASVNSALQRARTKLDARDCGAIRA